MKKRNYITSFIAILISIAICSVGISSYADQSDVDDQNTQDITLKLLPIAEGNFDNNTENTVNTLPKMNEESQLIIKEIGFLLTLFIFFSYLIKKGKKEFE